MQIPELMTKPRKPLILPSAAVTALGKIKGFSEGSAFCPVLRQILILSFNLIK